MRVLVCGGRNYFDGETLYATLDKIENIELIIHGGAAGADSMARDYANSRDIPCLKHPANWEKYGKRAGPIRNQEMLKWQPDLVVAFPGGVGTADMVKRAEKAGIEVWLACASSNPSDPIIAITRNR